jgi:uncharacterized protein with HEPN domain
MRHDPERLKDIIEAIESIEKYASKGFDVYAADELIRVWVLHHIQIIGEAAANLSPVIKDRYPNIPWPDIVAMRNVLVHQYFGVDLQEVWDTATLDLPTLKAQIKIVLDEFDQPPD